MDCTLLLEREIMHPVSIYKIEKMRSLWLEKLPLIAPLYNAPNRHYHNWLHIEKCFALTDRLSISDVEKELFKLAFLYHDAIYIPGMESEKLSAELLRTHLNDELRNSPGKIQGGTFSPFGCLHLIYLKGSENTVSSHYSNEEIARWNALKSLFDDVDYAIMGSDWGEYSRYVENVKKEYLYWTDEKTFWKGRRAFLEGLKRKPLIFENAHSSYIFEEFEKKARKNIEDEIAMLHPVENV